jgi:predicted ATPase/DNA-binding SARP family transcriptional activator
LSPGGAFAAGAPSAAEEASQVDAPQGVLFQELGPFEAVVEGRPVPLGGTRQRLVLAALAARANAVVSSDRLIHIVWGDEPPDSALSTLQKYVYRLRSLVGGDRLVTRSPGYLLRVGEGESDASRFESLVADASRLQAAGELEEAHSTFDAALALWRGQAWGEFADLDFARGDVARLDGLRAAAIDDRTEVALAAGRHAEVIGELEAIVDEYPLRERPRGQLMLALYRAGRQADALRAYEAFRRYLGAEVGLEPSAQLVRLADAIVLQKPELDWAPPSRTTVEKGEPITGPRQTRPPPRSITRLVGRAAELDEVRVQLGGRRLLTLTGAGGVGKTRLALAAVEAEGSKFPDGVVWVDLASVSSPADVTQAVADALGVPALPNVPLVTSVCAAANGRRLLVVVDNCEHVRAAAASIAGALVTEAEPVTVLATSRELLGVEGECVVAVGPLATGTTDAPAVELLAERTSRSSALPSDDREVAALVEIASRLEGLPLALELAAARCRSLGAVEVARRLADTFRLLADSRRAVARHQTLDAALDWSFELLDDVERDTLLRLSVFATAFTLKGAEEVAGSGGHDRLTADDAVASLVDKSLLGRDGERFRMLETTRQYAADRLTASGHRGDAEMAHTRFVVERLETISMGLRGRDEADWVEELDLVWPDLRTVVRRGFELDEADAVSSIIAHLGMDILWRHAEALPWAEQAAARWGDRPGRYQAEVLGTAGVAAYTLNQPDRAVELGKQGMAATTPGSATYFLAEDAAVAGYCFAGRFDEALALSDEAFALVVNGDDSYQQAMSAYELAICTMFAQPERHAAAADRAVELATACGNPSAIACAFTMQAASVVNSDPPRAVALLGQGAALAASVRNQYLTGTIPQFLASVGGSSGPEGLATCLEDADELQRSGRIALAWFVLWSALRLLWALGRTDEAALALGACEASGVAMYQAAELPPELEKLQRGDGPARLQQLRSRGSQTGVAELLRLLTGRQPLPGTNSTDEREATVVEPSTTS